MPDWVRTRQMVLRQQGPVPSATAARDGAVVGAFNQLPVEVQEQLLLEDLLSAMMGIDGKWVSSESNVHGELVFAVNASITDQSLRSLMLRLLPLCNQYAFVSRFVDVHSRFEYGLVHHAFTAAIRAMLKEYLILVAQLEHQLRKRSLTLLRAWYYVQPSFHSMERLARICRSASQSRGGQSSTGGALLNVIYNAMNEEGDEQTRALYSHLLASASVPYFDMLQEWVYQGVIKDKDPYQEFQVGGLSNSNPSLCCGSPVFVERSRLPDS